MIEAMTQGGTKKRGRVLAPRDAYEEDPVILHYVRNYPASTEFLVPGGRYAIGGDRGPVLETRSSSSTRSRRTASASWAATGRWARRAHRVHPGDRDGPARGPPDPERRVSGAAGRDPPRSSGCPSAHHRHAAPPGHPHALRADDAAGAALGAGRDALARDGNPCPPPAIAGDSTSMRSSAGTASQGLDVVSRALHPSPALEDPCRRGTTMLLDPATEDAMADGGRRRPSRLNERQSGAW